MYLPYTGQNIRLLLTLGFHAIVPIHNIFYIFCISILMVFREGENCVYVEGVLLFLL